MCPCFRNRSLEALTRKSERSEAAEIERALAEAEVALERSAAPAEAASSGGAAQRVVPQRPKQSKTTVVKQLVEANAATAAEVARLRQQLAAAKTDDEFDAEELALIKAQLRAAKAAKAAQEAAAAAQPRQGFAPVATQNPAFAPR